ncbi:MAG: tetratricopeptide repeat protein [Cyclobacteriaceae bacterium]
MGKSTKHIVVLSWLLTMSICSTAQEISQAMSRVQDLIDANDWAEASNLLSIYKETCGSNCDEVDFTSGYFFQKVVSQHPDSTEAAELASFYYRGVLSSNPSDFRSRNNLSFLLFNQGDLDAAIQVLKETPQDAKHRFYLALGSMYQQRGDYHLALEQFRLALDKEATRQNGFQAIMTLFSSNVFPNDTLFQYCRRMLDNNQQELARRSLIGGIEKELADRQTVNNQALVWWVYLVSQSQDIRDYTTRYLSGKWQYPKIGELKTIMESSTIDTDQIDWWKSDRKIYSDGTSEISPREVMSGFLMGLGKEEIISGNIERAESYLLGALDLITRGHIQSYTSDPGRVSDVFFSIVEELSIFYTKYQDTIDPDNQKFIRLEKNLFSAKSSAYLRLNRKSIYKFHLTLGLIYTYRNQWTGSRYRNAHFQLENAVSKASSGTNTAYLSKLNAQGYKTQGNRDKALEWYAKSAINYSTHGDNPTASAVVEEASNSESLAINVDQMFNYAARYAMVNDYSQEAQYFSQKAVAFNANFANLTTRADILRQVGDYKSAEGNLQLALRDPNVTAEALYSYGSTLIDQESEDEALKIFNVLNERDDASWFGAHGLAKGYAAKGDYSKAIEYIELALTKNASTAEQRLFRQNLKILKSGADFN